jgi:hypothetical protein
MGGAGADSLTGYDQNLAALNALFAEWTSADSLGVRMYALSNGGGLNGSYVLSTTASAGRPQTVFDDSAADLLFDGAGLSWFFVHRPGDVVILIPRRSRRKG